MFPLNSEESSHSSSIDLRRNKHLFWEGTNTCSFLGLRISLCLFLGSTRSYLWLGRVYKVEVCLVTVSLFDFSDLIWQIRKENPKNSDCETRWLVYWTFLVAHRLALALQVKILGVDNSHLTHSFPPWHLQLTMTYAAAAAVRCCGCGGREGHQTRASPPNLQPPPMLHNSHSQTSKCQ